MLYFCLRRMGVASMVRTPILKTKGEELKKANGAAVYIQCSSKTLQGEASFDRYGLTIGLPAATVVLLKNQLL
ncbi:hypothetical protein JHK82_042673 [Glycine max]|nr:hypothetical protein JHK86_042698 [Glycine max]KAG5105703.1 hypothetical protein JHK82_042673 [Glycine max]